MRIDEADLRVLERVYASAVLWNDLRSMMVCVHCLCLDAGQVHTATCVYRAFGDLLDRLQAQCEAASAAIPDPHDP